MSLTSQRFRPVVYQGNPAENDLIEQLRFAAASKLCKFATHYAGGGSSYITIDEHLKIRFADHDNTSSQYRQPDFNFANEGLTAEDVAKIIGLIEYPDLCKITAFAMHVGLTVPKLKKLLTEDCYESVCENENYENTFTKFVKTATAFEVLNKAGVTDRIPVRQEGQSAEDYSGRCL